MTEGEKQAISKFAEDRAKGHFRRFGLSLVDEPNVGGKQPDFGIVDTAGRINALVEVESIIQPEVETEDVVCIDTRNLLEIVRDQIEHARKHFKHAKTLPCMLIIDASASPYFQPDPSMVIEAMLGADVFRVALYDDGSRGSGMAIASDGKVSRPHWKTPQNKTVSAVGVFLQRVVCCPLDNHHFDENGLVIASLPGWMQAALVYEGKPVTGIAKPPCTLCCDFRFLQVMKNPHARIEWPDRCVGPWDDVYEASETPGERAVRIIYGAQRLGAPEEALSF